MDLSKRVVLLKASVKEGEYPTFAPEDMIFLFEVILSEEVTCPEGVVLGHPDPSGLGLQWYCINLEILLIAWFIAWNCIWM